MSKFLIIFLIFGFLDTLMATLTGGDVVICRDNKNKIISAELFDFYEARTHRGIVIDLGGPHLTIDEKIDIALKRLEPFSPARSLKYKIRIQKLQDQMNFIKNAKLINIADSLPLYLKIGCKIEQVSIQKISEVDEDKLYFINQDFWDKMNTDNRAGLLLHDAIKSAEKTNDRENFMASKYAQLNLTEIPMTEYIDLLAGSEEREFAIGDSKPMRYFNSLISSKIIESFSIPKFTNILKKIKFSWIDINENKFNVKSIKFYPSENLKEAGLICENHKGTFKDTRHDIRIDNCNLDSGKQILLNFYDTTVLQNLHFRNFSPIGSFKIKFIKNIYKIKIECNTKDFNIHCDPLRFYENGSPRRFCLEKESDIKFKNMTIPGICAEVYESNNAKLIELHKNHTFTIKGKKIEFRNTVDFHKTGSVMSGYFTKPQLLSVNNKEILFHDASKISFFENGHVEQGLMGNFVELKTEKGKMQIIPECYMVKFNSDQKVVTFEKSNCRKPQ